MIRTMRAALRPAMAAALLAVPTTAAAVVTQLPASLKAGVFQPTFGRFTEVLPTLDGATHQNLPGVYGVELRRANNAANGDWEIGVGQATSNLGANNFNQGQWRWAANNTAGGGVVANFTLTWLPAASVAVPGGLALTLGANSLNANAVTVNAPTGARAPLLTGNTLKIFAKRDAAVTITSIDGQAVNVTATGNATGSGDALSELFLWSDDNWGGDGFTVTGQVRLSGAGGGSGNGVLFKHGSYVPEPATWALLILGFGLTGARLRLRNRQQLRKMALQVAKRRA